MRKVKTFHRTGFTLIELVVSLTVLGLILLMIFGTFRLGLSSWERGDVRKEQLQKVRMISQLITQQVKSLVPYKIKSKKAEGDYLAFQGKAHSLRFVSALSLKAKQPEGFVYVIYKFKEGSEGEGGHLVLYERKVLNRDFFEEELKEEEGVSLLENIETIRFEYYQEEDSEKDLQEGWAEEWDAKEKKEIPKALKMTIFQKNREDKGEELPITLMASLPAYRFEEVRTVPARFRQRMMQRIPQP